MLTVSRSGRFLLAIDTRTFRPILPAGRDTTDWTLVALASGGALVAAMALAFLRLRRRRLLAAV